MGWKHHPLQQPPLWGASWQAWGIPGDGSGVGGTGWMPIRHQGGVTGLKGRQGKQLTGYWKNKPPRPSNFSHESLSSDILVRAGSPSRMPAPNPGQKKKEKPTPDKNPVPRSTARRGGEPAASPHRAGCAQRGSPRAGGRQLGVVCVRGGEGVVQHSQNSSILPALGRAGAVAAAAQVRGNTAP